MANSHAGSKLYIGVDSTTHVAKPENSDLDATTFATKTWLEVKQVGDVGATGSNVNILKYNTWDTVVAQKAAGVTDGGDAKIQLARVATDPGQIQMRVAASPANRQNNYAMKILHLNGTIVYNRGLVLGPINPNGGVESFILEEYTLGCNQEQVTVDP